MNQSNKALREYRPEEWEDINAPTTTNQKEGV